MSREPLKACENLVQDSGSAENKENKPNPYGANYPKGNAMLLVFFIS